MDHIAPNCPNLVAEVLYVPMCGNCKQNGHTTNECNAPKMVGPRDSDGYVKRNPIAKLVFVPEESNMEVNRNVNHIENEDVSNREDLRSVMVQQVRTRR